MNYYLSLAALVPAVILFVRIYQLDRIEKEPRRLLGILLLSGALLALSRCSSHCLWKQTDTISVCCEEAEKCPAAGQFGSGACAY